MRKKKEVSKPYDKLIHDCKLRIKRIRKAKRILRRNRRESRKYERLDDVK